jgi:hypothetical protein
MQSVMNLNLGTSALTHETVGSEHGREKLFSQLDKAKMYPNQRTDGGHELSPQARDIAILTMLDVVANTNKAVLEMQNQQKKMAKQVDSLYSYKKYHGDNNSSFNFNDYCKNNENW